MASPGPSPGDVGMGKLDKDPSFTGEYTSASQWNEKTCPLCYAVCNVATLNWVLREGGTEAAV